MGTPRALAWSLALSALVLAAGCGGSDEPDAMTIDAGGLPGKAAVSWGFTVDDAPGDCVGAGVTIVRVGLLDPVSGSEWVTAQFPCTDGQATVIGLYPGSYRMEVVAHDAEPASLDFSLGAGQNVDVGMVDLRGWTISVTWKITRTGVDSACADVNADRMRLDLTPVDGRPPTSTMFTCSAFAGRTQALRAGTYSATARLVSPAGYQVGGVRGPYTVTVGTGLIGTISQIIFPF